MLLSTRNAVTQAEVMRWLRMTAYSCGDPKTDSYAAWGYKQDLYQIKFALDEMIRNCPKFSPEPEWLQEQEKKKVIEYLKG